MRSRSRLLAWGVWSIACAETEARSRLVRPAAVCDVTPVLSFASLRRAVALACTLSFCPACASTGGEAASSAQAPDQKFPIRFEREFEPGKIYKVELLNEERQRMLFSFDEKLVEEQVEHKVLHFWGTQQALAAGRHQPTQYVVEEFTLSEPGKKSELLPSGARIVSRIVGEHWRYEVDGRAPDAELDGHLGSLFGRELSASGDDEVFGSKIPRAVGESWPADVSHLPQSAEISMHAEGASGSVRLAKLRVVDGVQCLQMQADLRVPEVTVRTLAQEATVLRSQLEGKFEGVFPVDIGLPPVNSSMEMQLDVQMQVQAERGPLTLDLTLTSRTLRRRE